MRTSRVHAATGMSNSSGNIWPLWKLALVLYPFATAALAINLFMLGLLGISIGGTSLSPATTLVLSLPLGLPATWAAALWARHLLREASK